MPEAAIDLESLLAAYRPKGSEAGTLSRMCELLTAGGDAFRRSHFQPGHFTASAFVLSPARDSLLMIHHRKLDRWLQPGGHIEGPYELVADAARRELEEECGVRDVQILGEGLLDIDIHSIPARKAEPRHEHFDLRFAYVAHSLEFSAGAEVKGARWVDIEAVASTGADSSVLRALKKLAAL